MIDYMLLASALEHYKWLGYNVMDVPWMASEASVEVTKPPDARIFQTFAGCLVASGEQSFIEMMEQGTLPIGKSVCLTPCFRDDPIDELHQQYFMKVELIDYMPEDLEVAKSQMEMHALAFLSRYVEVGLERVFQEREGKAEYLCTDITSNGIELGSYGCREYKSHKWVYGTGCAEPRLSYAIKKALDTKCS